MMRSMFAGVSGLRSHQTMMDVVGNNISNVNTPGFKASRATFEETLTQVQRGATGPVGAQGGVNPLQIGLGARAGAIDTVFGQGATQVTGRATDLAIQGEGFFEVIADGEVGYTRVGAFSWDADGNLVTAQGYTVEGVNPDGTRAGPVSLTAQEMADHTDIQINNVGEVIGREADGTIAVLGQIGLATFPNPGGLQRDGGGIFRPSPNSGVADYGVPDPAAGGLIESGALEMSNVDLAQEFTNLIMAQRGFQANSRVITSSDEMLQDLVNMKR